MGDTTHAFDGRTDAGTDTTKTGYKYKDPDTCDLYTPGHEIATDFADVLDEFESVVSSWSLTADVVAGGCNGCTTVDDDVDVWANYVAQGGDNIDTLYVGYGATDDAPVEAEEVARTLLSIADRCNVAASWNGSTGKKVCLGDDDAYDGGDA